MTVELIKPVIEVWNIGMLIPYELNSKVHDAKQVERVAKSIREFGWDQPIVVDKDGVIIKGHGRRLAAISLGLSEVPVLVRSDLTPEQVRAARLADNRVAISDVDTELLQKELASLDFDLVGIFEKKELDFLNADLALFKVEAFSVDLDNEVTAQAAETVERIAQVDAKEIKIDRALGFKTIRGKDERHIARFMAMAEESTGKAGAEAFVQFAKNFVES
jgi:ParB-like chromosome segregation protein Spo0J